MRKFEHAKEKPGHLKASPMDAALKYLTFRARTVREMERYLDEKQYGEYEVQQTVDRLTELQYLNDDTFARDFVASRLQSKPVSRRKLYEQLLAHETNRESIESALKEVSDETEQENARNSADKYYRQLIGLPEKELRLRLYRRLAGRGYSHEDIQGAIRHIIDGGPGDA